MPIALVHHPGYAPPLPQGHRFPMPKYARLFARLERSGLVDAAHCHEPAPAPGEWLELAHRPAWVRAVLEERVDAAAERRLGLPVTAGVALRARLSVGGTVLAARLALVRGLACNLAGGSHHAFADAGTGFCVFNDVAVAARLIRREGGAARILVVDLDVHQGDGTAAILADDAGIFTLSVHCRTNFPARKQRSSLDVMLDPGTGDAEYLAMVERLVPALLDRIRPDLVFYNAGVDPHERDRLGRLALSDDGLRRREELVLRSVLARRLPLVCVAGGGYGDDVEEVAARHAVLHEVARDLDRRGLVQPPLSSPAVAGSCPDS